ncbi:MAG: methyltransferase domain-containing protein, partial [Gammaproteobacteria bacterium]|nr:methyltransferase domain-containing protein [Gammaproteobacteria bacterium]
MVAITSNKREHIFEAVNQMYTQVANAPQTEFHFPTGRRACEFVHYPDSALEGLPEESLESFAGVGYPFAADVIRDGDVVLDIGSGSGTDTLIASRLAGENGTIHGLELTRAMRSKLQATLERYQITNVEVLSGNAESIPLDDSSVDVVTSNGVLNLVPDKPRAIAEIFRVLRPGGRLQLADIALKKPVAERFRRDPELWAECVVGAVSEKNYMEMFRAAGFRDVKLVDQLDYFAGSRSDKTREVAGLFGAHSIVLQAVKPAGKELEQVVAERNSWRQRVTALLRQAAAVAAAGVAAAVCMGAPLLLSIFGAAGLAAYATHVWMFPVFVAFAAATVWGLHRETRTRQGRAPFWLGLAAAVLTSILLWLMITAVVPLPVWLIYAGLAVLLGASLWCLLLPTTPDRCLDEMIRHADRRERPLGARMTRGAALSLAAATAFYGLYKSAEMFVPAAEAGEIPCWGVNSCKGKTACATAFNACP